MTQLVLDLSPETVARIAKEAADRGLSVEAVALEAVEAWVALDDLDLEEDLRRLDEPGDSIPAEEVFEELRSRVAALRDQGQ